MNTSRPLRPILSAVIAATASLLLLAGMPFSDSPDFLLDTTLVSFEPNYADSRDFTLDTRLPAFEPRFADSNSFALDTTGVNRVWGDSEPFAVDDTVVSGLSIAPQQRAVSQSAGLTTFAVSNAGSGTMSWSAAVIPGSPWLRITSGASGVNGGTIYVGFDANQNPGSRTGIIRVSAPGAVPGFVDVQVVQVGNSAKPNVISQIPAPGATEVPLVSLIEARFDADLRASSVTGRTMQLFLDGPGGTVLREWAATVAYDAARRAAVLTPSPSDPLASGAEYRVVVSSLIVGADGTAIDPASWTFSTIGAPGRERVVEAIWRFYNEAQTTLNSNLILTSENIQRGVAEIWTDNWVSLSRFAVGFYAGFWFSSSAPVDGFAAMLDGPIRLQTVGTLINATLVKKGFQSRAELLENLGFQNGFTSPPDVFEVIAALNSALWIDDLSTPRSPDFHGISEVIDSMNAFSWGVIAELPEIVDVADAAAASTFLDSKRSALIDARSTEVRTYIVKEVTRDNVVTMEPVQYFLGQTTTGEEMLSEAIERLHDVQLAKLAVTISNAGLKVAKFAGLMTSLTGIGAVVVGIADYIPYAVTGIDLIGLRRTVITPSEAVGSAVLFCPELLSSEALWQAVFFRDSLYRAANLAAGLDGLSQLRSRYQSEVVSAEGGSVTFVGDPVVEDVYIDAASSAEAVVVMRNGGVGSATCDVVATVLVVQAGGGTSVLGYAGPPDPVTLQPGEEKSISFAYSAPRSMLYARIGYLLRIEADVLHDATGEIDHLGPIEVPFHVGTAAELGLLNSFEEELGDTGTLAVGEEQYRWLLMPDGLQSAQWRLSHGTGARMDMHLYDPVGNHTGFNYESDAVETAIVGSSYTGLDTYPQVIRVINPLGGLYRVRVVARQGAGDFTIFKLGVPPLPSTLTLSTQEQIVHLHRAGSEVVEVAVLETGGSNAINNLAVVATDLTTPSHEIIPADHVSFNPLISPLSPGSGQTLSLTVSAPPLAAPGQYDGVISVTGSAANDGSALYADLSLRVIVPAVGDDDFDGDIDLRNFAGFQTCFGQQSDTPECATFNFGFEVTGLIGQGNYAAFQQVMTGP
jgi:hypothetical protein